MEYGWRGAPHHNQQVKQGPAGTNIAVQKMLQEQGNQPDPQSYTARLEPRRRGPGGGLGQYEWPPRAPSSRNVSAATQRTQYFTASQPATTKGLKKVTWPPPLSDFEIEDGEQDPVYSQAAPATNGFASPAPQYAQQQVRGRQQQQQPQERRSHSRDRARRSPAWTPPPTIISLRQSPPIHQEPAPLVISQPATARMQATVQRTAVSLSLQTLQNGHYSRTDSSASPTPGPTSPVPPKPTRVTAKNRGDLKWPPEVIEIIPETLSFEVPVAKLDEPVVRQSGVRARGDAKWPPQEYKTRAEEENAKRLALAAGPVCRPRLPKKDYSGFFAQNQLNATYSGYRAPPGTQHYIDETGVSEF